MMLAHGVRLRLHLENGVCTRSLHPGSNMAAEALRGATAHGQTGDVQSTRCVDRGASCVYCVQSVRCPICVGARC